MPSNVTKTGHVVPADQLTQRLVPFEVPIGTTRIQVSYTYTGRESGNAIDLGLLGVDQQFRGYSGGSKTEAFVANDGATPGYLPGLIAPGEWYVMLGIYQIKIPGTVEIKIALDDAPRPEHRWSVAPARAKYTGSLRVPPGRSTEFKWLKGDFHVHTVYSDGKFELPELIQKAEDRGLDFTFSTEHNTNSANIAWGNHVPEGFLIGRGIEVTTYGGHWNAIGLLPHQLINPRIEDMSDKDASLVSAVEEVHKSDGLAIINHPFAECPCCDWDYSFHENMDAIEVWNGPWKRHPEDESNVKAVEKWDQLLRQGVVFTATGGSDIHEHKFEIAEPTTHVYAEENSTSAIMHALRKRRAYLTRHPWHEIQFFLANGAARADVGGWLEGGGATAHVKLNGFPDVEVRVVSEKGIIHRSSENTIQLPVEGKYVRIEVRDADDSMLGLTNPIWII